MIGSRTDLHIFDAGSVKGDPVIVTRFFFHMCVFLEALWVCSSFFMDDNAPCHRTVAAEQLLESELAWQRSYLTTSNDSETSIGAARRWAAMPQQLIDTLILSIGRRCETCLAVRGDQIPY
ncbi:hypothetical protein TNCV_2463811 [Trichonephila clavipes]|nr:hypothetical protein TNCV_2463811 [Trichonephila clavipes]